MKNILMAFLAAVVCGSAHAQTVSDTRFSAELGQIVQTLSLNQIREAMVEGKAQADSKRMIDLVRAAAARENAERDLQFPHSAERVYMLASCMAKTYFEHGGTRLALEQDPEIDQETRTLIKLWIENDPDKGVLFLKSRGHDTLQDVEDGLAAIDAPPNSDADFLKTALIKQVRRSKALFEQFKKDESQWLMDHIGSLR